MKQSNLALALLVAERIHHGETYDIYPYIKHVRDVVHIAQELGYDMAVQIACALHDVMENGDISYNDIKTHFGLEVAEIVYAVSDEKGRNRKERHERTYPEIRKLEKAVCTKLCDRIANVRHSMEYNPGKVAMYRKEHSKFFDALHDKNHLEATRGWEYLNKLME